MKESKYREKERSCETTGDKKKDGRDREKKANKNGDWGWQ